MEKADIMTAITILKEGGVVIYPTETAYAIGCDATNARAVRKIFEIKGREKGKPLPLIVADSKMAGKYGLMSAEAKRLAKKYWPGALTIITAKQQSSKAAKKLAPSVTYRGTVAMRVSGSPVARALSKGLGRPIVSTSANKSGTPVCYSVKEAVRLLDTEGIMILDAGLLPKRKPSTIVDVTGKKMNVVRVGAIIF